MTRISSQPRHASDGSTWARVRAGARTLATHRPSRNISIILLGEMVLAAPFIALVPAESQLTLNGSAADTGRLFAAQGIGSALGVLLIAGLVPRLGQERTVLTALAGMVVLGVGYALSPSLLMAILLILPLSGLHSSVLAGTAALLQRDSPPAYRGRVLSLATSAADLGYALASTLLAIAADHVGLRPVLIAGYLVLLALLPVLWRMLPTSREIAPR